MEKRDRQNGGSEQISGSRELQSELRPAPGKVTHTSKLSARSEPVVQRKPATTGSEATPRQSRPLGDSTRDLWMDAAHRGATALPEPVQNMPASSSPSGAVVQRKGEDKNFDRASGDKSLKLEDTPGSMQLPDELTAGMKGAWADSFPGGKSQEQGGVLLRNKDGSYEFKRGAAGTSGMFPHSGYAEPGKDQTLIGSGHTHPYDKSEGGHTDVSFSGADIANLIYRQDKMRVVQSGDTQFVLLRTDEFAAQLQSLDDKGKEKLHKEIKDHWNQAFQSAKGKLPDRSEAATKSTCAKYKLAYYRGKEGSVSKVDTTK